MEFSNPLDLWDFKIKREGDRFDMEATPRPEFWDSVQNTANELNKKLLRKEEEAVLSLLSLESLKTLKALVEAELAKRVEPAKVSEDK